MIIEFLDTLFLCLTCVMVIYLVRHYVFTIAVLRNNSRNRKGKAEARAALLQPSVSILIPARNEERVIDRLLRRMTELTYPKNKLQIIVIDDASIDGTAKIAERYSREYDYIRVVYRTELQGGRGKSSALNCGLRDANAEIVLCFDADYCPQRDIIEKLVQGFADPTVGLVQGRVTVLNEPQNLVTRLVALERVGGYRVDQEARNCLGLTPQFGGTVGGIRRNLLDDLGGWDESILAEDTELTYRVRLAGYKVRYVNDAECYEEAVDNWRAYWRQRRRWSVGHMQCFFKYWRKILRTDKLSTKEKIDGLLLLGVYFVPILTLLSTLTFVTLFTLQPPQLMSSMLWTVTPISLYSSVGNFAPFFEIGVGVYLDGRNRAQWLTSFLIFVFIYNILICTKALLDLAFSKAFQDNAGLWDKTIHYGKTNNTAK